LADVVGWKGGSISDYTHDWMSTEKTKRTIQYDRERERGGRHNTKEEGVVLCNTTEMERERKKAGVPWP
jgi:hypothetical protein